MMIIKNNNNNNNNKNNKNNINNNKEDEEEEEEEKSDDDKGERVELVFLVRIRLSNDLVLLLSCLRSFPHFLTIPLSFLPSFLLLPLPINS